MLNHHHPLEDTNHLKCVQAQHTVPVAGMGEITIRSKGFWSSRRTSNSDERDIRLYGVHVSGQIADHILTERELFTLIGAGTFNTLPA